MKNKIDVVIPTMWAYEPFPKILEEYSKIESINKIFLIDNSTNSKNKKSIKHIDKVVEICYGRNIYVNSAWNEGYYRSNADILCLLNDDISVDKSIFDKMSELDFSEIDVIGVHLKGSIDNYHIVEHENIEDELIKLNVDKTKAIGGQSYAFGVCMFIKRSSYRVIPSLYKIWYGDDYLIQNCKNIYALKTSKIKGEISKTITAFDKESDIKKRIELDSKNAYKFFYPAKNWDLVQDYALKEQKTIPFLEKEYQKALSIPSDINENLPILLQLAKECLTVTEMGVRTGVSTRAFLNTNVQLTSYDIQLDKNVNALFEFAKNQGKKVRYIEADVLNIEIQDTDLLFIDTYHVYEQLKKELFLHGNKARKYIAFHDTHTFGLRGENQKDNKGLLTAIIEFIIQNPHWVFKTFKTNNNGMTVLERRKY
jgi:hypothetical protein